MKNIQLSLVCIFSILGLAACGDGGGDKAATGSSESSSGGEMVAFVTTQDGSPMPIKAELFDTPQAKEFMTTGKNPYVGNAEAVEKGKKPRLGGSTGEAILLQQRKDFVSALNILRKVG